VRISTEEARRAPDGTGRGPGGAAGHFRELLARERGGAVPAREPTPVPAPVPCGGGPLPFPAAERPAGAPELARAVARIAVLLERHGGPPSVTLRLGLSLSVTLEQRPAGVEVSLHASRGLSPLAERELPGLLAALRARHVRVARAGVFAGTRRRRGR
jgi:hypothetical protein